MEGTQIVRKSLESRVVDYSRSRLAIGVVSAGICAANGGNPPRISPRVTPRICRASHDSAVDGSAISGIDGQTEIHCVIDRGSCNR